MSLDEEALQVAAKGGQMDLYAPKDNPDRPDRPDKLTSRSSDKWASMLDPLLERLDRIVYDVFPMPKVDPQSDNNDNDNDNDKDKDKDSERDSTLPAPLALLVDSIKSSLRSLFTAKPPHTVQRLAELILYPTRHYRTLPAYLRALDRVVCVTSSAEMFQLQSCEPNGAANGVGGGGPTTGLLFDHAPGSDEALGGALLTPIPWLGNISFEGDTEGESVPMALQNIQEEQLASQTQTQTQTQDQDQDKDQDQDATEEITTTTTTTTTETTLPSHPITTEAEAESEELPHARGPPVVGVEDMGLQDGKGVEMPLEEHGGEPSENKDTDDSTGNPEKGEEDKKDGDGDISLGDAKKKE